MHKKQHEEYYYNQHSCFLLQYHLVLITKYRKPAITGNLEDFLKDYTCRYFKDHELRVQAIETMPDHMHILFDAYPQLNLSEFINAFKSASSRQIRKAFSPELAQYYWKPCFWSLSYFIGSVSDKTETVVKNYINNQKIT